MKTLRVCKLGNKGTVNGLSVGKVAKIDFLPGTNKILVSFTIRNDVVFRKIALLNFTKPD